MSHENVDVVRKPAPGARAVEPHARSAAPAPLPSACRCVRRLIATLPPASRLRQGGAVARRPARGGGLQPARSGWGGDRLPPESGVL